MRSIRSYRLMRPCAVYSTDQSEFDAPWGNNTTEDSLSAETAGATAMLSNHIPSLIRSRHTNSNEHLSSSIQDQPKCCDHQANFMRIARSLTMVFSLPESLRWPVISSSCSCAASSPSLVSSVGGINSWPMVEKNVLRQTSGSMFEWNCYTIHALYILLRPIIHSKGDLHQSIARVASSGS